MSVRKFIGDRAFYKHVFMIAVPIIIQNAVTNFVGMLDNIMVGQVGTDQMNAVAIVNQLMFVFNLFAWGAVSGAGIFTVQYYGKGDTEGVRNTFRAKIVLLGIVLLAGILLFATQGGWLISQFLHETDEIGNAALTLACGEEYLYIMLIGLIPFAVTTAYANTLRDVGQTVLPMIASVVAVFINLIGNYILIFGKFGAPEMGAIGAAIATVISRFIECAIVVIWLHRNSHVYPFIKGAYKSLRIPRELLMQIIIKGAPLAVNEGLWSLGITMLNQSYSTRGLAVIGALNIASTISNLFNVVFLALGESISIVVGPLLGAGKMEEARDKDNKMIALTVGSCFIIGTLLALTSRVFPSFYNTEQEVKDLASNVILISSIMMPFNALLHGSYFTLRTGGKTIVTFIFDCGFVWCLSVPVAFCLAHFTGIAIIPMYCIVVSLDLLKCLFGVFLVWKGIWINNIVEEM